MCSSISFDDVCVCKHAASEKNTIYYPIHFLVVISCDTLGYFYPSHMYLAFFIKILTYTYTHIIWGCIYMVQYCYLFTFYSTALYILGLGYTMFDSATDFS